MHVPLSCRCTHLLAHTRTHTLSLSHTHTDTCRRAASPGKPSPISTRGCCRPFVTRCCAQRGEGGEGVQAEGGREGVQKRPQKPLRQPPEAKAGARRRRRRNDFGALRGHGQLLAAAIALLPACRSTCRLLALALELVRGRQELCQRRQQSPALAAHVM